MLDLVVRVVDRLVAAVEHPEPARTRRVRPHSILGSGAVQPDERDRVRAVEQPSTHSPGAAPLALVSTLRNRPTMVTSWPRQQSIALGAGVQGRIGQFLGVALLGLSVSLRVRRRTKPSAVAMVSPEFRSQCHRHGRPLGAPAPRAYPSFRAEAHGARSPGVPISLRGVVTVLLPGTGSDDDYLDRALAARSRAGAVVISVAPEPRHLVSGYLDALDRAPRAGRGAARIAVGGVSWEPRWRRGGR